MRGDVNNKELVWFLPDKWISWGGWCAAVPVSLSPSSRLIFNTSQSGEEGEAASWLTWLFSKGLRQVGFLEVENMTGRCPGTTGRLPWQVLIRMETSKISSTLSTRKTPRVAREVEQRMENKNWIEIVFYYQQTRKRYQFNIGDWFYYQTVSESVINDHWEMRKS